MQGVEFKADILVMPLWGADIVLGIQWLITFGDIKLNFRQLKMEFQIGRKKILLRGSQPGEPKMIALQKIEKPLRKIPELSMMIVAHIQPIHKEVVCLQSQQVEAHRNFQKLLNQYKSIFEAPASLPSQREHDHKIILKEDIPLVNVIPYRYPASQKNKIEKMILEMLDVGVIRPSTSPYSSPIVIVRRKMALVGYVSITDSSIATLLKISSPFMSLRSS